MEPIPHKTPNNSDLTSVNLNKGAFLHDFYNKTLLNMCAQVVHAVVFFTRNHWQNIQFLDVADKFA